MIKDITWEDIDKNNIQPKLGRIDLDLNYLKKRNIFAFRKYL